MASARAYPDLRPSFLEVTSKVTRHLSGIRVGSPAPADRLRLQGFRGLWVFITRTTSSPVTCLRAAPSLYVLRMMRMIRRCVFLLRPERASRMMDYISSPCDSFALVVFPSSSGFIIFDFIVRANALRYSYY